MRLAWSSRAALTIAPLQDVLNLGASARMNTPGQAGDNWRWRLTDDLLSSAAFDSLGNLIRETNRFAVHSAAAGSPAVQVTEVTP